MSERRMGLDLGVWKAILIGLLASGLLYYGWCSWQWRQAAASSSSPQPPPTAIAPPAIAPISSPTPAPAAVGSLTIDARLGHPLVRAGEVTQTFVAVKVRGEERAQGVSTRVPTRVALVIDRSGSMSGERLQHAKAAALVLTQQLRDGDQMTVITYDDGADVILPMTSVRAHTRAHIASAIEGITIGGSTCISCGLALAEQQLDAAQRVSPERFAQRLVLLSDGRPNRGIVDLGPLNAHAQRLERQGTTVSTIGVGLDYNERLMAAMAFRGNGNHHFVENPRALTQVLEGELDDVRQLVAQHVELTLTLPVGVRFVRGLDREFRPDGQTVRVSLGDVPAGSERTALIEVALPATHDAQLPVAGIELAYQDLISHTQRTTSQHLSAQTTRDPAAVTRSADPEVAARIEQSRIAQTLDAVEAQLQRGDLQRARHLLHQQRLSSQQGNEVWGSSGLGSSIQVLERLEDDVVKAQASPNKAKSSRRVLKQSAATKGSMKR